MQCPRCKQPDEKSPSSSGDRTESDVPPEFSRYFVLKHHEAFRGGLSSSMKKEHVFFDSDDNKTNMNRPVPLRSLDIAQNFEYYGDVALRSHIYLTEMEKNVVHTGRQLHVWVVTRPELTQMSDGTIYLVVRDKFDFYVRLVISNWSHLVPTRQIKSSTELARILDDLLPTDSFFTLFDPLLSVCSIDGHLSLRCDTPNIELMLTDRIRQCAIIDKLDDLRQRGNQAYVHGDIQLAIEYYTFCISRITSMTQMVISKGTDSEMCLFAGAYQLDLCRFHSNRSACYLRERLYSAAFQDTIGVTTGRLIGELFDEVFCKSLYRHMYASIALQKSTPLADKPFQFFNQLPIDNQLRVKYALDFNQLESKTIRLKRERRLGEFDLQRMFVDSPSSSSAPFDFETFHANFIIKKSIIKRSNGIYATCDIPNGQLLLVEQAFAFVYTDSDFSERRLLNEVEKRLILSPTMDEFKAIRCMSSIEKWCRNQTMFDIDDENEDEDDILKSSSSPKTLPWNVLVETQQNNPFRSKSLLGWWPKASNFQMAIKPNCFWFVCGETILIFTLSSVKKGDALVLADTNGIRSFLDEQRTTFDLKLGDKTKVPLNDIFEHLQKTQIFFD